MPQSETASEFHTSHTSQDSGKGNPRALFPVLFFLVLYLGAGIYYEYIHPTEGQMGFYVLSIVVAFGLALITAFLQNKAVTFEEKIHICAQGVGDDNIIMMLFIFLMAGAFSGIAAEAGGVESCANLLLSVIPQKLAVPGLFLIACLISMSMGTSVGTISVLVPIAAAISAASSISAPLAVGTVVGGAMFGDNLSFISDTTIAATKTQGVEMKDKFRTNVKIALPAAVLTLLLLTLFSFHIEAPSVASYPYRIGLALPYFIVLLLSLFGINVFLVLGIGLLLFSGAGLILGTLSLNSMFSSMGKGTNGMFETMIVTILVASLGALIEKNGGFDAILSFIRTHFHGQKGGAFGIMILTSLLDIASANNTVAIVMAAPIARTISREYRIDPRQTASLLDTSSCICQGIIPYGAQLLIAANLSSLSSMSIIPWLFYPFLLFVSVIVSILLQKEYKKA